MYALGSATAFTGFAVAADTTGLFRQLGVVGPILSVLHIVVGALLVLWLIAFAYALLIITLRRVGRGASSGAPIAVPVGSAPQILARRSVS